MDNKNDKIASITAMKITKENPISSNIFQQVYDLAVDFNEYLNTDEEFQISYFDEIISRFKTEMDYIIKITKEVSEIEPEKLNNSIAEFSELQEEILIYCFNRLLDVLIKSYEIDSNEIYSTLGYSAKSLEYAVKNLEIGNLIVDFLLEYGKMLLFYLNTKLLDGKQTEKFVEDIFKLATYKPDEITTVHMEGKIRASNTANSEILGVVTNDDFFTVTGKENRYYKVKFYDSIENTTINGFILKKDVLLYSKIIGSDDGLNGKGIKYFGDFRNTEKFLKHFKSVYESDETVENALSYVLNNNDETIKFFNKCLDNYKDDYEEFMIDIINKIGVYLENNDER